MNKILIALISMFFFSCAGSQDNNKWSSVSYMYDSGPLPPEYQYNYVVTIHSNGEAAMVYFIGADPSNSSLTYDFKCTPENLKKIGDAIAKSKILDEDIKEEPEGNRPIGGHLEKVRVVLEEENPLLDRAPRMKESPYFPLKKYRDGLNKLFETVASFVPENVWLDIEKKKSELKSK